MKILIVDDYPIKRGYWPLFIRDEIGIVSIDYDDAHNYKYAILKLNVRYDIAVIDYDLRDEKTGLDFLNLYQQKNPQTLCLLYSAFPDEVNRKERLPVLCLSMRDVEEKLKKAFATFDIQPIPEAYKMTPPAASMALPFSEKLCDERHAKDKEDHASIKSTQEKYETKNDFEHNSIRSCIESFKTEIKGHNNKVFWVIVAGVGAQFLTFITVATFVLTVAKNLR